MLSVVITSHHDDRACYLTTFAVKAQLEGHEHEIIVVADGGTETKWENAGVRCLRVNTGSPQGSRDAGIRAARADDVLVLESHVVVSDILKLQQAHQNLKGALTFPCRIAEGNEMFDVYGATVNWNGNLWYKNLIYQAPSKEPYRVAQFGNSAFIVDREWYLASGGYTGLLTGWGAEESFICLKAWILGRECWLVPDVWHAHHLAAGAHVSEILGMSPAYERNFQVLGYVIAGRRNPSLVITPELEAERRQIVAGPFGGDLELLREHMNKNGVVN